MVSPEIHPRRCTTRMWLLASGLGGIVVAVLGSCVGFDFLTWDDPQNVLDNPRVDPPSWQGVAESWREPYWGMYVPVNYTFLAAEAAIARRIDPARLRPAVFHAGNLLLHVVNALMVFAILRRLSSRDDRGQADVAAGIGALLFALHPLQVESVAWISETRGLLCGLFSLSAIWLYVEYADPARGRPARAACYIGAAAALALALLSKPAAVALPLLAAGLAVGLLRRRAATVLLELSPWLAGALVAAAVASRVQPGSGLGDVPPLVLRPLIALDAVSFYLGKLLVPVQFIADYGRTPAFVLSGRSFQVGWLALPAAVVILAVARQRRVAVTSLTLFVAWFVPVMGFVPFDFQRLSTVADRYAYLAMLGPAVLAAWIVGRWRRATTVAVAGLLLAVLATLSFLQLGAWRDTRMLFTRTCAVNPRSPAARYQLGYAAFREGRLQDAIDWYRSSLETGPNFIETRLALSGALYSSGQVEAAGEALREARERTRGDPRLERLVEEFQSRQDVLRRADEEIRLGVVEQSFGRFAAARRHFQVALEIEPRYAVIYYNLGNLEYAEKNWPAAAERYRTALEIQPEYAPARANLGAVLLELGERREAIRQIRAALASDAGLVPARLMLGQALLLEGSRREAAAEFREALRRTAPDSPLRMEIEALLRRAEGR